MIAWWRALIISIFPLCHKREMTFVSSQINSVATSVRNQWGKVRADVTWANTNMLLVGTPQIKSPMMQVYVGKTRVDVRERLASGS